MSSVCPHLRPPWRPGLLSLQYYWVLCGQVEGDGRGLADRAREQGDIPRTGPETWGSENHAMTKDTACRLLSPTERMRGAYYDGTNKLTDNCGKSGLRMRPGGTFRDRKGSKLGGFRGGRVTCESFPA